MTGNASVNLINTSMFGLRDKKGGIVSTGLFDLSFGNNGVHGAVSMSGTDMNLGNLAQCFTGYEESRRVYQMKHSTEENNTAFESIAMLEHTAGVKGDKDYENYRLARELAGGTKRVALTNGVSKKTGEIYLGMVDPDDSSVININQSMLGGGTLEDYAKLAAVMSHEGKHAYGEHVESAVYAFGGDSYLQMVQNVGLKGDVGFIAGIASAMSNKENDAINAQGAQELWKLVKNDKGEYSFEWDKSTDLDLSELGL